MAITENDIDRLYQRTRQERKGTKAYWQALNDLHYAESRKHLEELQAPRKSLKGTPAETLATENEALRKDVTNLKAQLESANEEHAKELAKAQAETEAAQDELTRLRDAVGLSPLDWEMAKARGQLPSGAWLT